MTASMDRAARPGGLPANDPLYLRFGVLAQYHSHDPVAVQVASALVSEIRLEHRRDPARCRQGLTAHGAQAMAEAAVAEGVRRAASDLYAAEVAWQQARLANDELEAVCGLRERLPEDPVDVGPLILPRRQVRADLAALTHAAEYRAAAGDRDHEDRAGSGAVGWVLAVLVALIEAGITLRVFNVDFDALAFSALTWLAVTAAFLLFNHWVVEVAGTAWRDHREISKQNRLIAVQAMGTVHGDTLEGLR